MQRFILPVIIAALLIGACNKDSWPCPDEYMPGPAVVTIMCADAALQEELGEETLAVEYSYDGEAWQPCYRHYLEAMGAGSQEITQPVCDSGNAFSPKFECGGRSEPQIAGTFYIRATQGERSAGPLQITTRMKDRCYYDEATLYHELHLDMSAP